MFASVLLFKTLPTQTLASTQTCLQSTRAHDQGRPRGRGARICLLSPIPRSSVETRRRPRTDARMHPESREVLRDLLSRGPCTDVHRVLAYGPACVLAPACVLRRYYPPVRASLCALAFVYGLRCLLLRMNTERVLPMLLPMHVIT